MYQGHEKQITSLKFKFEKGELERILLSKNHHISSKVGRDGVSGLLNVPKHKDDKFNYIDETVLKLFKKYNKMPNSTAVWNSLKKDTDFFEEYEDYSKTAFLKRWRSYTSKKSPNKSR
jgi:hypothetical protein